MKFTLGGTTAAARIVRQPASASAVPEEAFAERLQFGELGLFHKQSVENLS